MQKESESGSGQMQRGSQNRARAVSLGVPFPTLNDIAKAQLQRSPFRSCRPEESRSPQS